MQHHPNMMSSTPRGTPVPVPVARQSPKSSTHGHHHHHTTTGAGAPSSSASVRYCQTQLSGLSSLPRSQHVPPALPRPTTIAIELTASPRRQTWTARTPSEPSSGQARTIPQMWKLSRRDGGAGGALPAGTGAAVSKSESGTPVVVSAMSATTRTTTTVTTTTTTTATATATRSTTSSATPPVSSRGRGRTRGRPRASERSIDYSSMHVRSAHAAASSSSAVRQPRQARVNAPPLVWGRRAGRPPKQRSPSPRELYHRVRSPFLVFLCEWDGCKAELHNLDTLRRHVHVVHGPGHDRHRHRHRHRQPQPQQQQHQQPPWTCRWGQCENKRNNMTMTDTQDWHAHLEEAHFAPFVWHVGDGPRNTSDVLQSAMKDDSDDDNNGGGGGGSGLSALPDYLMGPDGTQVTPSIRDQELEDFATWKKNRRRLKEMLILRDSNLPDLSSEGSQESD
ncbi:hypothetical protein E4U21_000754 [Claviceps maximensis]|nr:hypothetical protein E4U21_000754 [Claviceps maximensis]